MHDASQNVQFSGVASVTAVLRSTVTFHTLAELSLVNNDEQQFWEDAFSPAPFTCLRLDRSYEYPDVT